MRTAIPIKSNITEDRGPLEIESTSDLVLLCCLHLNETDYYQPGSCLICLVITCDWNPSDKNCDIPFCIQKEAVGADRNTIFNRYRGEDQLLTFHSVSI